MKLSQQIEKDNQDIIQATVNSLFIQKLGNGTLDQKIFDYYIAQDIYLLNNFARAAGICVSKAKDDELPVFLEMQKAAFHAIEYINSYYTNSDGFIFTTTHTPAQQQISAFMLRLVLQEPIEIAFCGLAPVPWIRFLLGQQYSSDIAADHPYERWIKAHKSPMLFEAIECYKDFIDRSAEFNPGSYDNMRKTAQVAFVQLYNLWNDVYNLKDAQKF